MTKTYNRIMLYVALYVIVWQKHCTHLNLHTPDETNVEKSQWTTRGRPDMLCLLMKNNKIGTIL